MRVYQTKKTTATRAALHLMNIEKVLENEPKVMASECFDYISQLLESLGYQMAADVFDRIVDKTQFNQKVYLIKAGEPIEQDGYKNVF